VWDLFDALAGLLRLPFRLTFPLRKFPAMAEGRRQIQRAIACGALQVRMGQTLSSEASSVGGAGREIHGNAIFFVPRPNSNVNKTNTLQPTKRERPDRPPPPSPPAFFF